MPIPCATDYPSVSVTTTEARYSEEVLGDAPKAAEAYRALLALEPQDAVALTNLGLLTWFEGDLDEASELASRAIRADSGSIPAYTNLVDAQVIAGRLRGGRDHPGALAGTVRGARFL